MGQKDLFRGSQRPLGARVKELHCHPSEPLQTLHCSKSAPQLSVHGDGDF